MPISIMPSPHPHFGKTGRPRKVDVPIGKLRAVMDKAKNQLRCTLDDLTVFAPDNDPFRMDTDAKHRDAEWFTKLLDGRTIHNRGCHYMAIGSIKPNGDIYTSTDENYQWIDKASKSARWLEYIPFEQITDERNSEPIFRVRDVFEPEGFISIAGVDIDLSPSILLSSWQAMGLQPYRIALFGEKTSLEPILVPLSEKYNTDLCMPSGETSDTMLFYLAKAAVEDGRTLIVLYFSDCDPGGHQMAISVSWKLQGLRELKFPTLEFRLYPVALTVAQVRNAEQTWGFTLPSSPLKEKERRKDKWRYAFGLEQTEIDSLVILRPDLLTELAEQAIAPWFDATLDRRMQTLRDEWERQAEQAMTDQIGGELNDRLSEAQAKIDEFTKERDEMAELVDSVDLPDLPDPPEPDVKGESPNSLLVSSDWDLGTQAAMLKRHKEYKS